MIRSVTVCSIVIFMRLGSLRWIDMYKADENLKKLNIFLNKLSHGYRYFY
jgi:hypothetical protein